ncbi:MAG: TIGR04552 family protein [Myxococcales bacterium]|nr:TIGR04552 family protein [Myxococcales bacterium]
MEPPRKIVDSELSALDASDLRIEDLEAVRLLLRGGSVIDWHQLDFHDYAAVDRFLKVNEFDPSREDDMLRLEEIRMQAVDYLAHNFEFEFPESIAEGMPARDIFLVASKAGRHQVWACVILKVMHIIHHLAGRELATRLSISHDKMYHAIELKVMQVVEELRADGFPIIEFEWSRKTLDSLISKLIAKRSTLAASIYDKLRFRMIVRNGSDLLPIMAALHRRLIPFNYVVPGESVNHLISFDDLETGDAPRENRLHGQDDLEMEQVKTAALPVNEFSAPNYKIINFVADLPVRVESFGAQPRPDFGHVVFVLTEFQICDKQTATANELGDNNHASYKMRQHERVRQRLMRGRKSRTLRLRKIDPNDLDMS